MAYSSHRILAAAGAGRKCASSPSWNGCARSGHWVALAAHPGQRHRPARAGGGHFVLSAAHAQGAAAVGGGAAGRVADAQPGRRGQHAQLERRLAGRTGRAAGRAADPDPLAPHRGRLPEPVLERPGLSLAAASCHHHQPADRGPAGRGAGDSARARDLHRHRASISRGSIPEIAGTLRAGTRPRPGRRAGRHDLRAAELEGPRHVSRCGRAIARRCETAGPFRHRRGRPGPRGAGRKKSRRSRGRATSRCSGIATDVPNVLASLDVLVLPSYAHEGIPQIILQAQAMARPVVATTIGGIPEVVEDGVTGLLVPPRDPAAGGKDRALLADPDLRRARPRRARGGRSASTLDAMGGRLLIFTKSWRARGPERNPIALFPPKDFRTDLRFPKLPSMKTIYLVASGDLRLSANQKCQAAQAALEKDLIAAIEKEGCARQARPSLRQEARSTASSTPRNMGMEVFRAHSDPTRR